jgi:hypothetical protein
MKPLIEFTPHTAPLLKLLGRSKERFEQLVYGSLATFAFSPMLQSVGGYDGHFFPPSHVDVQALFDNYDKWIALFNAYMEAVKSNPIWTDVLSSIHGQLVGDANGKAQFFTPQGIADVTAMLYKPEVDIAGKVSICDPSCGAGALLLAFMRNGTAPMTVNMLAGDIDPLCCAMTALQFVANFQCHGQSVAQLVIHVEDAISRKGPGVLWDSKARPFSRNTLFKSVAT